MRHVRTGLKEAHPMLGFVSLRSRVGARAQRRRPFLLLLLLLLLLDVVPLPLLGAATARADEWPQWRGPGRDGVWKEQGLIEKFEGPQIPLRWRARVSNGYSGPTVAGGRV